MDECRSLAKRISLSSRSPSDQRCRSRVNDPFSVPPLEITQSPRSKLFRMPRRSCRSRQRIGTADRIDRDRDGSPRSRADKIDRKQCRSVVESSIARTTVLGTFSAATRCGYLSCRFRLLTSRGKEEEAGGSQKKTHEGVQSGSCR